MKIDNREIPGPIIQGYIPVKVKITDIVSNRFDVNAAIVESFQTRSIEEILGCGALDLFFRNNPESKNAKFIDYMNFYNERITTRVKENESVSILDGEMFLGVGFDFDLGKFADDWYVERDNESELKKESLDIHELAIAEMEARDIPTELESFGCTEREITKSMNDAANKVVLDIAQNKDFLRTFDSLVSSVVKELVEIHKTEIGPEEYKSVQIN